MRPAPHAVAPHSPASNRVLGKRMAAARGWTGGQWNCLDQLAKHESGWNHRAQNPTSTAYGIHQFLDGTWRTVGVKKTDDPAMQISAGLTYIKSRYGSPCSAWSFWQRQKAVSGHNWY